MSGTHEHDSPAQHSMVLFGDKALYLMHMADFDPTHNDQVILEVSMSKNGVKPEDQYRKDRQSSGAAMYSVKPQPMVLSELKPDKSFIGEVHRGNFEVEPDLLVGKVTITVKRVVHLQQIDPKNKPEPGAGRRYLCFGPPGDLYAVHEITSAPSFDQVIPIRIESRDPDLGNLSFTEATPLRVPGEDDEDSRLKAGEKAGAEFPEATAPNGERGVQATIVASEEIFFDASFLKG